MKMYVNKDAAARAVLKDVLDGTKTNITVSVGSRPYMCFDIWGDYMNTVEYVRKCGCTEYVFPEKGDKK